MEEEAADEDQDEDEDDEGEAEINENDDEEDDADTLVVPEDPLVVSSKTFPLVPTSLLSPY